MWPSSMGDLRNENFNLVLLFFVALTEKCPPRRTDHTKIPPTTAKGKLESTQSRMNNCSSGLSPFMPDKDFSELLWENSQIVKQGQSNRPCKRPFNALSSQSSKFEERVGRDGGIPKNGQFGVADTAVSELSHAVRSGQIRLNAQVADMGPWINYPIEENDYPPEFFSEFTGVNLKSLSALSNTIPSDRSSGFGHPIRDSPNVEHRYASKSLAGDSEASRIRTGELFPLSQQWQSLVPSRNHQVPCGNSQADSVQKQGAGSCKPAQQSSSVGLRNFPHFSRPVALVISNLQSVDESRSNVKASTAASSNPMGSTVINSDSGLKGISVIKEQSAPVPPKPPREGASGEQLEAVFEKDTCRNKNFHNITGSSTRSPDHIHHQSSNTVAFARRETEKGPEAVVASSSVCSANSAGAELNDPTQATKRKDQEGEESGYQSEDLENDSVGLKKVANGRGMSTKRSRAAEVHNLSERRRRDRINEKMRALQELIPNCNRVDKASMLDEAIEYLKTLQLQVQIMSMGSGLCMHPMMLPAGMQHRLPPPMAHFSPMSVNMGLGYGMGMNGSSGFPMMPVRPMHGPQFHYASMPVHGMPGSTGLQMFGIPGQGIPVSMPNTPPFGPLSGFTARVNMVPDIRGATTSPLPVADAAPSSNSKDQEQHNIT